MKTRLKKIKRFFIKIVAIVRFHSNDSFLKRQIKRTERIVRIKEKQLQVMKDIDFIRKDRFNRVATIANSLMDYLEKTNCEKFWQGSLERIILDKMED